MVVLLSMRTLPKSYQQRRQELRQSLHRLDGAIDRYKKNAQIAELGTIAIELRGLVVADGGLLLSLSKEKGFPLELYTYSPVFTRSDTPFPVKYVKVWEPASFNLTSEPPWTQKVSVEKCLDRPVAEIKGSTFNVKRLITEITSTFGPAHYSGKVSVALAEMKEDIVSGVPSHFATLLNFAETISKLGQKFLDAF